MSTDTKLANIDRKQTTVRVDESDYVTLVLLPMKLGSRESAFAITHIFAIFPNCLMYIRDKMSNTQVFLLPEDQIISSHVNESGYLKRKDVLYLGSDTSELIMWGEMKNEYLIEYIPPEYLPVFKHLQDYVNMSECRCVSYSELEELYEKKQRDISVISVQSCYGNKYQLPFVYSIEPETLTEKRDAIYPSDLLKKTNTSGDACTIQNTSAKSSSDLKSIQVASNNSSEHISNESTLAAQSLTPSRPLVKKPAKYPQYSTESSRLQSYSTWPHTNPSAGECARAGFFYTGEMDIIRCFQCGIGLKDFSPLNAPLVEHIKHVETCPYLETMFREDFLKSQRATIKEMDPEYVRRRLYEEFLSNRGKNNENTIVRSPQFRTFESRMMTFKNNKFRCIKLPEHLAEAGLYYTGDGNEVRCFYCNGGHRHWEENDDPWTEHCRWFPACGFAREIKGDAFIEQIQKDFNERTASENVSSYSIRGLRPEGQHRDWKLDTLVFKFVEDMGYALDDFDSAIRRLRLNGRYPPDIEDIVDEIAHIQKKEHEEAMSGITTTVCGEDTRMKTLLICKLCNINESNVLFLPCAHHTVCIGCARDVKNCPRCNRAVNNVITTYRRNYNGVFDSASEPHLSTQSSYADPIVPITEEGIRQPELDTYTSHVYHYVIDVASLPAYTYCRTSIQGIERKCRKYLKQSRFSERDTEVFLSKGANLFTTLKQSSILKIATSMNSRIEIKEIANKINCTYAPCVFVIKFKELHIILHILKELQLKGLDFCVLIIGDKPCTDDLQPLRNLLVAYASENDIQVALDDLFERFAFSVLRKLLEQIATEVNIGSDVHKTDDFDETLHEIYQHVRAAYNNSGVPVDERPLIPEENVRYPSNVNAIIAQVLQVQDVVACFKNNGRLKIYVDKTTVESEKECTNTVIKILATNGFDKYSVVVGTLERFCQAGDPITDTRIEATLGGFADKCNELSQYFNRPQQESNQEHENDFTLVALISRHVATNIPSGDLKVSDKILGHIKHVHDCHWLDIVPVDVAQEVLNDCETRFRTENDILKHAELNGNNLANSSPVHIWGAKSSPGLGFLSEWDPSKLNMYMFVVSRSPENVFCQKGDSGSIICSSDRKGRLFALGILIGKFTPTKIIEPAMQSEIFANTYEDIPAEEPIKESKEYAQNKLEEKTSLGDESAHGPDNRRLTTEPLIYIRECKQLEPQFVALNLVNAFEGLSENYKCEFRLCTEKKKVIT